MKSVFTNQELVGDGVFLFIPHSVASFKTCLEIFITSRFIQFSGDDIVTKFLLSSTLGSRYFMGITQKGITKYFDEEISPVYDDMEVPSTISDNQCRSMTCNLGVVAVLFVLAVTLAILVIIFA